MKKRLWLTMLRLDSGKTQKEVSKEVGIGAMHYSRIENGIGLSMQTAKSIAKVLNFNPSLFFEEEM